MSFTLWPTTFIAGITKIPAAFVNYVATSISNAVDGAGGGIIAPTSTIEVQGTAGITINGTGNAAYLRLGSRTETRTHVLTLPAACTSSSITLGASGSFTINGLSIQLPLLLTTATASTGHYHIQEIERPIAGATLTSVNLVTGYSVANATGMTVAKYQVVRWTYTGNTGVVVGLISGGFQDDNHNTSEANAGTIKTQTMTCNQNNVIDTSQYRYGVLVRHPNNATSNDATLGVLEMTSSYTVTSLRPA